MALSPNPAVAFADLHNIDRGHFWETFGICLVLVIRFQSIRLFIWAITVWTPALSFILRPLIGRVSEIAYSYRLRGMPDFKRP